MAMLATSGKVQVIYGTHCVNVEIGGLSVAEAQWAYRDILNVSDDCLAFVNGHDVLDKIKTILVDGDRLEFMGEAGSKGQDIWTKREFMRLTGISEKQWKALLVAGLQCSEWQGQVIFTESEAQKWIRELRNAQPQAAVTSKPTPPWSHEADELPPPDYCHGPLEGTQQQLAVWISGKSQRDGKRLQRQAQLKIVWVKRLHKRDYEVWFRNQAKFADANRNRLMDKERR